jgi:RES domain-containing protein
MRVWRICKRRYAGVSFSGEGARLFSGRWNPSGVPIVYSSLSLSLAAMEVFVHLEPMMAPNDLVSVMAELPIEEQHAERIDLKKLPRDWRRIDHPVLQGIGEKWARSGRSLVLLVPSIAVLGEWNALINPAHPDAAKIRIEAAKLFQFDARMFRSRQGMK